MHTKTITSLNALNRRFYETIAPHFSQSRQHPWPGWYSLVPALTAQSQTHQTLSVADIGCGNARFAKFLAEAFPSLDGEYLGIDNNDDLLHIAKDETRALSLQCHFQKLDVIEALLNAAHSHTTAELFPSRTRDVAVAFGVLHHIPSLQLRETLLSSMSQQLKADGLIIVTTWQFDQDQSLAARMKSFADVPETANVAADAEPGDYILTWERNVTALRYCHLASHEEMVQLAATCHLTIENDFVCDGQENTLNHYYLLRRST